MVGLRELEPFGDLGEVPVAVAQEPQDPQPGLVAQRPVQPQHADRRRERVGGLEGGVRHGVDEHPPVAAGEREVVRPREVRRGEDHAADAGLGQPPDAVGRALDELGRAEA